MTSELQAAKEGHRNRSETITAEPIMAEPIAAELQAAKEGYRRSRDSCRATSAPYLRVSLLRSRRITADPARGGFACAACVYG